MSSPLLAFTHTSNQFLFSRCEMQTKKNIQQPNTIWPVSQNKLHFSYLLLENEADDV